MEKKDYCCDCGTELLGIATFERRCNRCNDKFEMINNE